MYNLTHTTLKNYTILTIAATNCILYSTTTPTLHRRVPTTSTEVWTGVYTVTRDHSINSSEKIYNKDKQIH